MKDRFFIKIGNYLDSYGIETLNIILNIIVLGIAGLMFEYHDEKFFGDRVSGLIIGLIILLVVAFVSIILHYRLIRKKTNMSELEQINSELSNKIQFLENDTDKLFSEFVAFFNLQLALIFNKLQYTGNERISVYRKEMDNFELLGRYSLNPEFKKIIKKTFPSDIGYIAKAWESADGEFFIDDIPSFNESNTEYSDFILNSCNIDKSRLTSIRMKSRTYFCFAINDSYDLDRKAIIVFESMDTKKIDIDKIKSVLNEERKTITLFVERMKKPSTDKAKSMGY